MGFLVFIWNAIMRLVGILGFILMEAMIFGLVYLAVLQMGHPVMAGFLAFIFVIWMIAEIVLRVVVGGTVNLFKYLLGRFIGL